MAYFKRETRQQAEKRMERWASFNAAGVNEQELDRARAAFPKRMRLARILFAAAFSLATMAALVLGLFVLVLFTRFYKDQYLMGWSGIGAFIWLGGSKINAILIMEMLVMLIATSIAAAISAGIFTRLYLGSARVLRALYGRPIAAGLVTALALIAAATLPYFVGALWNLQFLAPTRAMMLSLVLGLLIAVISGRRAERHAQPILPEDAITPAEERVEPDRPEPPKDPLNAVIIAKDPLARAAYEGLLEADGAIIALSADTAEEARVWLRRKGMGAEVVLINDDLEDIAPPVLITHLVNEAQSPIGLVRLQNAATVSSNGASSRDAARGQVAAIEHVATPTTRGPLMEAARRAAKAARNARALEAESSLGEGFGPITAT